MWYQHYWLWLGIQKHCFIIFQGWVVKKVTEEVTCDTCKNCLTAKTPSLRFTRAFTLLNLKDRGHLQRPSDAVILVLTSAERHLRQMTNMNRISRSCTLLRLEVQVLQDVGSGALGSTEHALETAVGVDNHCIDLLRLLIKRYFTVHHITRLHTSMLQKQRLRQKYTKLVLFKGQWNFNSNWYHCHQ